MMMIIIYFMCITFPGGKSGDLFAEGMLQFHSWHISKSEFLSTRYNSEEINKGRQYTMRLKYNKEKAVKKNNPKTVEAHEHMGASAKNSFILMAMMKNRGLL